MVESRKKEPVVPVNHTPTMLSETAREERSTAREKNRCTASSHSRTTVELTRTFSAMNNMMPLAHPWTNESSMRPFWALRILMPTWAPQISTLRITKGTLVPWMRMP